MESIVVRKAKELDSAAKQWVQRLLGRQLEDDEQVTVLAFPPHAAPPEAVRQQAVARLNRILDKAAANAEHIPERELDAGIDEAMDHVRRWEQ